MPKFYFHVLDEATEELLPDPLVLDLPDIQSVRVEACESVKELIMEAIRTEKRFHGRQLVIADGAGKVVMTLSFEEAVNFAGDPPGR